MKVVIVDRFDQRIDVQDLLYDEVDSVARQLENMLDQVEKLQDELTEDDDDDGMEEFMKLRPSPEMPF